MTKAETLRYRRNALREKLDGACVLVYSGTSRYQNIESNLLPFRASSYFLYLFGRIAANVIGVIGETESVLFLPERDLDTLIWEGDGEPVSAIAQRSGVDRVLERGQLGEYLDGVRTLSVLGLAEGESLGERDMTSALGRKIDFRFTDSVLLSSIAELRLSHDDLGIDELRRAGQMTASALLVGMANTEVGKTDLQLKNMMEAHCLRTGFRQSFPSIVTVRSEVLHQMSSEDVLRDGDLLLADIGAETPFGYAGDCTRCWPVSGRFSSEQSEIYDIVKDAHDRAIDALEIGRWFLDVHQVACRSICEGLKRIGILRGASEQLLASGVHTLFFPHGVGHLIGLDVHDMEDIGDEVQYEAPAVRSSKFGYCNLRLNRRLRSGMAVTIEPGIYFIPALLDDPVRRLPFADLIDEVQLNRFRSVRGVRLEDAVLLHSSGIEILTGNVPIERSDVERVLSIKQRGETAA
jgi:Xaa-Pro aminopeptidase